MGDTFTARGYLNKREQLAQDTTDNYRFHDGGNLLSILAGILREHPHNGWSLFGIKQALAAQGKTDPTIDARLAQA